MIVKGRSAVCVILVGAVLTLAGCGQQTGATPTAGGNSNHTPAQVIRITATDNAFEPKSITVQAGTPISLTVVNNGKNVHEVEVEDLMPESKILPGQSKVVLIDGQSAGTHRVYCEIHEDEGMEGDLVVK